MYDKGNGQEIIAAAPALLFCEVKRRFKIPA